MILFKIKNIKLKILKRNTNNQSIFLITLFGLVASRIIGAFVLPVFDDAFITFRYAENLASGIGFVYNAGENVLGVTTPLFALIVSVFSLTGINVPIAIIAFNIQSDCIFLWLIYRISEKYSFPNAFPFFALLFSISPIITRVTVGAMEMNLFALASFASIYFFCEGRKTTSVIIATIAYFLRPESAILVILLVIYEYFSSNKINSVKLAIISLTILVVPFSVMYGVYGGFIPQSITSKSGLSTPAFSVISEFFFRDFVGILAFPLALVGIFTSFKKNQFLKLLSIWATIYFIAYLFARPHVWPWYPHIFRIVVLLFAALAFDYLITIFNKKNISIPIQKVAIVNSLIPIIFWIVVLINFGTSPVQKNVYSKLENWCKGKGLETKKILANDIGIIGYYSKANIFDTQGLRSPRALKYKTFEQMIVSENPDYLFININKSDIMVLNKYDKLFEPIERFSKQGYTDLHPKPESMSEIWQQDYIIYKRLQ